MMSGTPIELKLYDAEDNVIKTLTRSIVPWGMMKRALRLANHLNRLTDETMSEASMDEITGFIAAVFSDSVSVAELDAGADTGDMVTVMQQIISKAQGLMPPNATGPGK
jgi:hypothetical protein